MQSYEYKGVIGLSVQTGCDVETDRRTDKRVKLMFTYGPKNVFVQNTKIYMLIVIHYFKSIKTYSDAYDQCSYLGLALYYERKLTIVC